MLECIQTLWFLTLSPHPWSFWDSQSSRQLSSLRQEKFPQRKGTNKQINTSQALCKSRILNPFLHLNQPELARKLMAWNLQRRKYPALSVTTIFSLLSHSSQNVVAIADKKTLKKIENDGRSMCLGTKFPQKLKNSFEKYLGFIREAGGDCYKRKEYLLKLNDLSKLWSYKMGILI